MPFLFIESDGSGQEVYMQEKFVSVIQYGLQLFNITLPNNLPSAPPEMKWDANEALVGEPNESISLSSILSLVHLNQRAAPRVAASAPRLLTLEAIMPQDSGGETLVQGFEKELEKISRDYSTQIPLYFHAFYHLFRKYAWSLPAHYGGVGISLFE
ncbi:MAG: hypothetical protein QW358_00345 [Candidatus Hadarchaeum sp.]